MSDVVANSERSPRNGHWLRAVTDDVHSTTVLYSLPVAVLGMQCAKYSLPVAVLGTQCAK